MTNPLIARGQPKRHIHMALGDLVLAIATAFLWLDVVHFDFLEIVPSWAWAAVTLLLLLSAAAAYRRHLKLPRTQPEAPRRPR